ncbi:hypothetical protein [Streptomyces sp. NPDC059814]|uniref:hypothetical protein n=1 Tax=unclassified Streptomyces TaxID=2593676 RepID=UPI00365CD30E
MITSAAGAGAAGVHGPTVPGGGSIRAAQPAGATSVYRGVQGGNLCLLARCSVGSSTAGGNAGPSNTQGFNLCLLALCTVRP